MSAFFWRWLGLFAACFILASCIEVEDFGAYWDEGTLDPGLAGAWYSKKDTQCTLITEQDADYLMLTDQEENTARTLSLNGHAFLMIKKDGEIGGELLRYTLTKDTLTFYQLNEAKKDAFERAHASPNIVIDSYGSVELPKSYTATIQKLDLETAALLQQIAGDPSYWKPIEPLLRRADCGPSDDKH